MQNIFSNKIKKGGLVFIVLGIVLVALSFLSDNKEVHNYPWSSVYIALIFFTLLSLGALFFMSLQYATQSGWSVIILRVMEGIASFLPVGGIMLLVFFAMSSLHLNHIFHWMNSSLLDENSEHYDKIIAGKSTYLNIPFFIVRSLVYLGLWSLFLFLLKKKSSSMETESDRQSIRKIFFRTRNLSAIFLVIFAVTSSTMAWDWIMSIDTHWFSTLFGWYVFAGMIVSAVSTMLLISLYLHDRGFLPQLKKSHIHDLAKFMFGFSIFWMYLWFSQFVLIWYSNIPEEVTYFMMRFENYKVPLFLSLILNFLIPILLMMDSDNKKNYKLVRIIATLVLLGHYLNTFVMIAPGSMGEHWNIGFAEIGSLMVVKGIFLLVVFKTLSKKSLIIKNHPMLEESEHFSYYNIEDSH